MKTLSKVSIGVGLFLSIDSVVDAVLKESSLIVPLFMGGLLFLLTGYLNEKNTYRDSGPYVAFAIASFSLFMCYIGIIEEKISMPRFSRRYISSEYTLADNPEMFWFAFALYLLIAIFGIGYGLIKLKKEK